MKRYLIPILIISLLASGLAVGCGSTRIAPEATTTPKEEVREFAQAVVAIEKDRDDLIVEYQASTKESLDMSTMEVFEKAEYFVKTHAKLRKRMLSTATPSLEIKEVHSKFLIAYAAENKAYLAVQSFLVSVDEEKLYDSIKLFSEADTIFLQANDMLNKLLSKFGLQWSDIR